MLRLCPEHQKRPRTALQRPPYSIRGGRGELFKNVSKTYAGVAEEIRGGEEKSRQMRGRKRVGRQAAGTGGKFPPKRGRDLSGMDSFEE